ncbi:MAG: signal peptidase II [Deltaproteobacteria bacterium]|nr:signal peptidase II [Deltaproteobacteria bacterium]
MPKRIILFVAIALACLAADQATKVWARRALGPREYSVVKKVIPGYFELRLAYNTGSAFSLGGKTGWAPYALTVVGIGAVAAIAWFAWKTKNDQRALQVALGMLAGGAIGNIIDRLAFGKVTDFVVWKYGKHEWPAFNIADAALLVGVAIMLIAWPRDDAKDKDKEKDKDEGGAKDKGAKKKAKAS